MNRTNSMNTVEEPDNRISDVGLTTSTEQKQAIPQSVADEELAIQLIPYMMEMQLIMNRTNSMNTVEEPDNTISDVGLTTSTEQKQVIPQSVLDEELATQLIQHLIAAQLISGLQPDKLADKEGEVTFGCTPLSGCHTANHKTDIPYGFDYL